MRHISLREFGRRHISMIRVWKRQFCIRGFGRGWSVYEGLEEAGLYTWI